MFGLMSVNVFKQLFAFTYLVHINVGGFSKCNRSQTLQSYDLLYWNRVYCVQKIFFGGGVVGISADN